MRLGVLLHFDLALAYDSRSGLAGRLCGDAFGACFCVLFRFDRTPWGGYVAVLRRVAAALPRVAPAGRSRGSLRSRAGCRGAELHSARNARAPEASTQALHQVGAPPPRLRGARVAREA